MRTAIFFKGFQNDETTLRGWGKLKSECGTDYDCYFLFDRTNEPDLRLFPDGNGGFNDEPNYDPLTKLTGGNNVFYFDEEDYRLSACTLASKEKISQFPNLPANISRTIFFNPEYADLLRWQDLPQNYDYVWQIEADVWFNGNWKEFFKALEQDDSAFLGTYFTNYPTKHICPEFWDWYNRDVPNEHKKACYGPIYRASAELLDLVAETLMDGWHSYYEQTLPTIASLAGLKMKTIIEAANQIPKFEANAGLPKVFWSGYYYDPYTFGGFANPNWIEYIKQGGLKDKLFHPVKDYKLVTLD